MRPRLSRTFAVLLLLPLAACLDESPPSHFRPVSPPQARQPGDACPELAGLALDPASAPFIAEIVDRPAPDAHGLPLVLAFRRGPTQQEMWWVVPRPALLAFARDLQQRDPDRYARWREHVIRGSFEGSRAWDIDGYLAELSRLGPPGRVYAGIASHACKAQWTQAKRFGVKPSPNGPTEREYWFARDERGDLLVRDVTWRLTQFSVWASSHGYLRLGSTSTWQRLRTIDPGSVEALTEADLPAEDVMPPVTASGTAVTSVARPRTCRDALPLIDGLSQRLTAMLPPEVSLESMRSQRAPNVTAESWPEPSAQRCRTVVVQLEFEAPSLGQLQRVYDQLRDDGEVLSIDVLTTAMGEGTVRQSVRAVLR